MCEKDELKLICNSHANALLICKIMMSDDNHKVYRIAELEPGEVARLRDENRAFRIWV